MTSTNKQVARIRAANTAARVLEDSDQLAHKALALRRKGYSWYRIAEELNLPEAKVASLAHQAIAHAASLVSQATREHLLELELERLDELQVAVWDDAMSGDTRSVAEARAIIAQRMKALGLDLQVTAVTNQTVIITGESDEYRNALAMIREGRAG